MAQSEQRLLSDTRRYSRCLPARTRGFTLVELLVVVAVLMILLAITVAAVSRVSSTARSFVCKNGIKTVAFDFTLFADDGGQMSRGDDEVLGPRFKIETFQEMIYGIDEFWDLPGENEAAFAGKRQPMVCAEGSQELRRLAGVPCSGGAVLPYDNVSIGFNMRLFRRSEKIGARWVLRPVQLSTRILDHPGVPLLLDVDGVEAVRRNMRPYYTAPAAEDPGKYGDGSYWFPAARHDATINVGFVDGHVESVLPDRAGKSIEWAFQPEP